MFRSVSSVFSLMAVVCLCHHSTVHAQGFPAGRQPGSTIPSQNTAPNPAQDSRVARPQALDATATLDPEIEKLLVAWERHSSSMERVEGTFQRIVYDQVFMTVHWSEGKYFFQAPDQGRIDFRPHPGVPEAPNNKQTIGDKVYEIQADKSETWICNGKELLTFNIAEKTYNRAEIPVHLQGVRISEGPLPFLFGMKADKAKERFVLQFGPSHDPNTVIHLIAFPLQAQDQQEFRRAEIRLDPRTFMPQAMKLWDPTGQKESVYRFENHNLKAIGWVLSPFRTPNGFKLLHDVKAPSGEQEATGPKGTLFK